MKKKLLSVIILLIVSTTYLLAQPTVLGTQLVNGSYSTYNLTQRGGARFVRLQATSSASSGARNWEFATGSAGSANYSTNWRPYTSGLTLSSFNTIINPAGGTASALYNTSSGGQSGLLPAITSNYFYTVLVGNNSVANNTMSILETSYSPTSFSTSSQSPVTSNVYYGQQVTVNVTMAGNLSGNIGENVFLRYSIDNFASNSTVVQMSNSIGNTYTGNIPGQINGTTISYYLFTSNISSSNVVSNPSNADFYSLNIYTAGGQNIGGSNFSYTVGSWATVNSGATNFSSNSSWVGGLAPVSGSNLGSVTINDNISLDQSNTFSAISIAATKVLTVNFGNTLITNGNISGSGSLMVNGSLQLNTGSSTNISPIYGSASTLIYNQGGAYAGRITISNEWPSSNGSQNITILNNTWLQLNADRNLRGNLTVTNGALQAIGALRTLTMNGTSQTITISTTSGGAIYGTDNGTNNDLQLTVANGSTTTWTGDATISADDEKKVLNVLINTGGTLILSRGILCKYGTFTVNGTLQINANGYVQSGVANARAAAYSSGNLIYNNGGTYTTTDFEWPTTNSPTNVTIQNASTIVTLNNAKSITGTLSIASSTLFTTGSNNVLVANLTLGSLGTANNTWGSTASAANYKNSTYFGTAGTGIVTVTNDTRATPTVTVTPESYTYSGLSQGPSTSVTTNTGSSSSYTFSYVGTGGTTYSATSTLPTNAGTYTVTSTVAASTNGFYKQNNSVATAFSIGTASLIITGVSANNKVYNGLTTATLSGTAAYSGLVNGESFSVTGTPTASFATASVGTGKPITVLGYTAPSANYTVTQPSLSANITAVALTITGVTANNKGYDGNTTATLSGTPSYIGLQNGESFSVTGTPTASFTNATAGTGKTVSVTGYTAPSSNYSITQPTLLADIIGISAAAATDFRSGASGNLSTPATWQFDEGGGSWVTSTIVPIGKNITIQNTHTITQDVDYTVAFGTTFNIASGGSLIVAPTSTLTIAGTANFGGQSVTLQSTSQTNGGAIGTITGTLNGASNVTVQRYTQAQRGYRTLAHPFTTPQSVALLTNTIRVTGLGAASGTYGVTTGSPSVFSYNPTKPAGTALVAITNASTPWAVGSGWYTFIRGAGNEGQQGSTVVGYAGGIISPVTISGTGTINQGDVTVTLGYSAGQDNFNLIGNPYPCPINLSGVTGISSFGNVYVYNPAYSGSDKYILRGGFAQESNKDIIIPAFGAFYIQATGSTPSTITFHEANKVAGGTSTFTTFGTGTATPKIGLEISTSAGFMDRTKIAFDANATSAASDFYDGVKLGNSLVTFYSLSSDRKALGIDYRKTATTDIIPLGIQTSINNNYTISLSELTDLPNTQVVLRDKLLKTETVLSQVGDSYSFAITADTATKGENRFEIGILGTTVLPVQLADITAQLQTNKTVAVSWTSTTEVNLANYKVQRSKDGSSFSTVGTVAAKGASAYSYNDDLSTAGILPATIYYRLEAVDKDGSKTHSKVVAVALGSNLAKAAINIYPNPVQATLFAQVTVTKAGTAQLSVIDVQGKIVATQKTQLAVGTTSISIPASQLVAGNYVLEIVAADGSKQTQRFVKE